MNVSVTCPFCKIKHTFSSSLITAFICPTCNYMLQGNIDYNDVAPTRFEPTPDDGSVISIGDKITVESKTYYVIGKIRYQLTTNITSKWILINNEGSVNYLFEFSETYALLTKYPSPLEKQSLTNLKPLDLLTIKGFINTFQVKEIYKNIHTTAAGEIENFTIDFEKFDVYEFANEQNEYAFIQSSFDKNLSLYVGQFVHFNDLLIESKTIKSFKQIKLNCPKCKNIIDNRLKGKAVSIVCSSCLSLFSFDRNQQLVTVNQFKKIAEIDIPIGSKGKINNIDYTVIGYMLKKETDSQFIWKEYWLKDQNGRTAVLSEFNGHYNLSYQVDFWGDKHTKNGPLYIILEGEKYHIYNRYGITILSASGEFTFNISATIDAKVQEFINPPYIFFTEIDKDSATFFKGIYVSAKQVQKAFEMAEIPIQVGVGSTQTMVLGTSYPTFVKLCVSFLTLILAIQIYFSVGSSSQKVFNQRFIQSAIGDSTKVLISNSFEIKNAPTVLQFDIESNVSNNWFGVTIELINHKTGDRFEVDKTIEFYSGIDGGESWSEGSRSESVFMSQVPAGTYHINLYPEWGSLDKETNNFSIWVYENVPLWSNFWITCLVGIVFISIHYLRFRIFESRRWEGSDFNSPYITQIET